MSVVVICLLCGIILGLRFKVLVLAPATSLVVAAITIHGAMTNAPLSHIFGFMISSAAALQLGYLCGGIFLLPTFERRARAERDSVSGAHSSGHVIN